MVYSTMNGAIGIIAAMEKELNLYLAEIKNNKAEKVLGIDFYSGTISDKKVVACVCGVGKVNSALATTIMIMHFDVKSIINTGVSGGIGLNTLTAVIANKAVQYDSDYSAIGEKVGFVEGIGVEMNANEDLVNAFVKTLPNATIGLIASGDKFVSDSSLTKYLNEQFGAVAVDCETASIFHVAIKCNVPVVALRVVSDSADEEAKISFTELVSKASDLAASAVIKTIALI